MAAVTIHSDFGAQEEEEDLPDPGIKPQSSELQMDFLLSEPPGKPQISQEANVKLLPEYPVSYHVTRLSLSKMWIS